MNSKERMAFAMRHQEADRVPLMCQLAVGHYFLNTGLPPHQIWFTSEGFAQALVQLQARYHFDGILINIPGRDPRFPEQVSSIANNADGEILTWRNGDVTFIPWDDNAQHQPADPARRERADFETIDPDRLEFLDDLPMYTWNTYHVPYLADKGERGPLQEVPFYFYRTMDLVKAAVGHTVSIHGEVFSPFTHYMELFGYERALITLIEDPEKAEAILDRLTEASVAWAVAQARSGVDAVLISSAFAGAPFVSRSMYRRFVVPFERRVTAAVHGATGTPVYTHTCGSIGDRLELMAESGTDGIDTLDPPPLGNVELADAKRRIGERLFIKGNMNPVAILQYPTVSEVQDEARRCLQAGKPSGGYILSTACSVAPRVAQEKLKSLLEVVETEGAYK
ncbi:MAG: uroporphyrinogen decarboxylase family protein [Anaerolineae bacterium]|nr:uroporphyrinogen decarboxylase family protein [Anaerolineae bacterium]